MIYITSYIYPDIDGMGCAIAYKEYLSQKGQISEVVYTGTLGLETEFVAKHYGPLPLVADSGVYPKDSQFILVDNSDTNNINQNIDPLKVIQIIDHHISSHPENFPNAKITLEKVGSCATLIAEIFQKENFKPGTQSATLLYSAIISNTVNFQNSVTTDRDKKAAEWLKNLIDIPEDFIKNMFLSKSNITSSNLDVAVIQEYAVKNILGKNIGIAQLEIVDTEKFMSELKLQLLILFRKLKDEKKVDYFIFSAIDILLGFNYFLVLDPQSGELFSRALSLPSFSSETKTDHIIMRKQIWPLVEEALK